MALFCYYTCSVRAELPLYPRGPRSGPGYAVEHVRHQRQGSDARSSSSYVEAKTPAAGAGSEPGRLLHQFREFILHCGTPIIVPVGLRVEVVRPD